jgi:UDP-glucose 4-epimerase
VTASRGWQPEAWAGRRVLITGGLGMIGSTLAHALVGAGARVTVLDALLPLYGGNRFNLHGIEDRCAVEIGDIRDRALVERLVRGQDAIFNLAAQVSYQDSMTDPFLDLDINCRGQLLLLEACRTRNRDARIVFAGSRLEYGRILYSPVDEGHPIAPQMIYGIHKFAGERYHLVYAEQYGLRATALRLANPYGVRQQMRHSRYGLVNWFLRMAMEGKTITVFGDGAQRRDYVYVTDIVDALLAAAETEKAVGAVYNVGSGVGTRFRDMAHAVVDVVGGGEIAYVDWPPDYVNIDTGDFVADTSSLQAVTAWRAGTSLPEGIRATHEYYQVFRRWYWD